MFTDKQVKMIFESDLNLLRALLCLPITSVVRDRIVKFIKNKEKFLKGL